MGQHLAHTAGECSWSARLASAGSPVGDALSSHSRQAPSASAAPAVSSKPEQPLAGVEVDDLGHGRVLAALGRAAAGRPGRGGRWRDWPARPPSARSPPPRPGAPRGCRRAGPPPRRVGAKRRCTPASWWRMRRAALSASPRTRPSSCCDQVGARQGQPHRAVRCWAPLAPALAAAEGDLDRRPLRAIARTRAGQRPLQLVDVLLGGFGQGGLPLRSGVGEVGRRLRAAPSPKQR